MKYYKCIIRFVCILLSLTSGVAVGQISWRSGRLSFSDGSTESGRIAIREQEWKVKYGQDIVSLPIRELRSVEFNSVSANLKTGGYSLPIINATVSSKAGVSAEIRLGPMDWNEYRRISIPEPSVLLERVNPLTRITENQSMMWTGLVWKEDAKSVVFDPSFSKNGRVVTKVEFND